MKGGKMLLYFVVQPVPTTTILRWRDQTNGICHGDLDAQVMNP